MFSVYKKLKKWDNKKEIKVRYANDYVKEKIRKAIDKIPDSAQAKLVIGVKGRKKDIRPFTFLKDTERFFPCIGNWERELFKRFMDRKLNYIPAGIKNVKVIIFWNKDEISKMEEKSLSKPLP